MWSLSVLPPSQVVKDESLMSSILGCLDPKEALVTCGALSWEWRLASRRRGLWLDFLEVSALTILASVTAHRSMFSLLESSQAPSPHDVMTSIESVFPMRSRAVVLCHCSRMMMMMMMTMRRRRMMMMMMMMMMR
jgi:hypothetical protein